MVSFFPPIYHDELFYSVLARFHQRSGNESCKQTLIELFNKSTTSAISDFTGEIGELCKNIDQDRYKPIEIIKKNTLLPYYLPFITKEQEDKIKLQMIQGNSVAISVALGLAASKIKETNFFRFCISCFVNEKEIYGEPYWHRTHQLPGVIICPKHKETLSISHIPYRNKQNKHRFFTLDETSIKNGKKISVPTQFFDHYAFIAEQSYRLLNEEELLSGIKNMQNFLFEKLIRKGYLTPSKRLKMKELVSSFLRSFPHGFLDDINSNFIELNNDTWFHKVLRKPRVACHPVRYLLVFNFLEEVMPKSLLINHFKFQPFGIGPWPCLNKASLHYKELKITNCVITSDSKTKQPVGTFICDYCDFIYSRRGPDRVEQDKYKIGRVKNFGNVWLNKLYELDALGEHSTLHISSVLGVDSNTVKKYLRNKDNKVKNEVIERREIQNRAGEMHKENFLALRNENPKFSRTQLRRANPSTYMWLYRNEKNWLFRNLPSPKKPHKSIEKVNWVKRDEDYSVLIIKEAINMLFEDPLIRISKSRIGIRLDIRTNLETKINKLPCCKSLLKDITETVEDFQIRRVRFHATRLRQENLLYTRSSLLRASGLKSQLTNSVNAVVIDELTYLKNEDV
ncbi:TnsD family Tn7-like transposition protein [Jeotgalibacillus campisalis]|uniref:Uncharacterized protein n=1 Tax=Jeotgalibacillus campisalis TaxID=220754 RepID=A0A0C2W2G1_9BACL|nr:TnsD family Tn7-like transposition protein [Jeotgalibacillus campisalis]KIL50821.1 hypothetical protein KR50_07020 [Jeotgalibacillus campisalis]